MYTLSYVIVLIILKLVLQKELCFYLWLHKSFNLLGAIFYILFTKKKIITMQGNVIEHYRGSKVTIWKKHWKACRYCWVFLKTFFPSWTSFNLLYLTTLKNYWLKAGLYNKFWRHNWRRSKHLTLNLMANINPCNREKNKNKKEFFFFFNYSFIPVKLKQ